MLQFLQVRTMRFLCGKQLHSHAAAIHEYRTTVMISIPDKIHTCIWRPHPRSGGVYSSGVRLETLILG